MSRLTWNDCCCNPIGITGDMVLVRAGWYHFLVMTLDGRVNCFIGSGLTGAKQEWYGGNTYDTRRFAFLDNDWARVNDSVRFSDRLTFNGLAEGAKTVRTGGSTGYGNWIVENNPQDDVLIHVPALSTRTEDNNPFVWYNCNNPEGKYNNIVGPGLLFDTNTGVCRVDPFIPYKIFGALGCTGATAFKPINGINGLSGYTACIGCTQCGGKYELLLIGDDFGGFTSINGVSGLSGYTGTVGYTLSFEINGPRAGCWYNRNKISVYDNEFQNTHLHLTRWWPHGYMEFDGSGCTVSRPWKINGNTYDVTSGVTSDRWMLLMSQKYGVFGDTAGITYGDYFVGITNYNGTTALIGVPLIEEYKSTAIPAPSGHPLAVPDTVKNKKVIDIQCGAYHNIVRFDDNTIACWGLNSMGQCNVPSSLQPGVTAGKHPKLDKILSLHAGFSTTAVLFNDGTALCWGDPDVACAVNNWNDIKISPIKRHNGFREDGSCVGFGSDGFPDPVNPKFAANKYDRPTFNANTDWFKYWRRGTAGYPEFDLGVEVNPIYPVNWSVTGKALLANGGGIDQPIYNDGSINCNVFDPKSWCSDCVGMTVGKDFAVGMLRTGQIVTTRKVNSPSNSLYSRDCSTDAPLQRSNGIITPPNGGYNYKDIYFCCGGSEFIHVVKFGGVIDYTVNPQVPNGNQSCFDQIGGSFETQEDFVEFCEPQDGVSAMPKRCRNVLDGTYKTLGKVCDTPIVCDAYKKWSLPGNWLEAYNWVNSPPPECGPGQVETLFNLPEGVGCYSSNVGESGYDPNWASTTIYTPGEQVRSNGFTGGRYPDWNVNLTPGATGGVNYGWSTLAASTERYRPGTKNGTSILQGVPPICAETADIPSYCTLHFGEENPCDWFCPSAAGGFYSTAMGDLNNNAKGVPGVFHYPDHLINSLTCVAGTNTVAWVSNAKLLEPAALFDGLRNEWITQSSIRKCQQYHLSRYLSGNQFQNLDRPCSECANIGSNPGQHIEEVGDTSYGCIFSNHTDRDNNNNPFRRNYRSNWCTKKPSLLSTSSMLPSKPWGPFNIETDVGYAAPNVMDYGVCGLKIGSSGIYVTYKNGAEGQDNVQLKDLPWNNFMGPAMPRWFTGSCYRSELVESPSGYPTNIPVEVSGTIYGYNYPNSLVFSYFYDTITSGICGDRNTNPEDQAPNESGIAKYDCYTSNKTCGCSKNRIAYLWTGDMTRIHCDSSTKELVQYDERLQIPPGKVSASLLQVSGQKGFTCDAGIDDRINRWCFNNPIISYATGRSFGVHIRACPWIRGLSGEFIWKDSCQENTNYLEKLSNAGWTNSTKRLTKTLKLWVSGILEDPCPPWPVDVGILGGQTCGVYPSWVPVPSTNTTRRADKGQWSGVVGDWSTCTSTAQWCYTVSGQTCGCTAAGCYGCETAWPIGMTGCTGFGCATELFDYP